MYRVHGATPRWHVCHTGPGQWSEACLTRMDAVLIYFRNRYAPGIPAVYVLGGGSIPSWVEADTLAAWREHVRYIAGRYKGLIQYYEIWNEPNAYNWYQGSPALLAELTKAAAEEIRSIDPAAKIIGPSFTEHGHEMLDAFYALDVADYIDIVGWHHGIVDPEADTVNIVRIERILAKHGIDKPVWVTEMNVIGGASELARTYLVHWLYGIKQVGYYSWEMWTYGDCCPGDYAHTTLSDGSLTEAGHAYNAISEWLVGNGVVSLKVEDGLWIVELSNKTWIVWSTKANKVWDVPADVQYMITFTAAHTAPASYHVTNTPVLFH